jgi:hypothetical protein
VTIYLPRTDSKKEYDNARFLQDVFENKLQNSLKFKDSAKPVEVQLYEKVKEEYENSVFIYDHLRTDLEIKIDLVLNFCFYSNLF